MSRHERRLSRREVLVGAVAAVVGGAVGTVLGETGGSSSAPESHGPTPAGTTYAVPGRNQGLPPSAGREESATTTSPEHRQKHDYVYSKNRNATFDGFLDAAAKHVAVWVNNPANGLDTRFTSYEAIPRNVSGAPASGWGKLEIPSQEDFPFTVTATVYRTADGLVDPDKAAQSFSYKADRANQTVAVYAPGHPEYNVGWEGTYVDPDMVGAYTAVISGHAGNTGPVVDELVSGPTALDSWATAEQLEGYDREFFSCVSTGFGNITAALER